MIFRSVLTATAAAAALMVSVSVQAAPIHGTGSAGMIGVTRIPPGSIGLGTIFNSVTTVFAGGTGDLAAVGIGTFFTTGSVTATNGTSFTFTSAFGNFTGTVSNVAAIGPASNRVVSLDATGTFTPLGVLGAFTPGLMNLTFSATQTGGPNSSVSASYTISSVRPPRVAEPATLALLGAGLLGFAAIRRRKTA